MILKLHHFYFFEGKKTHSYQLILIPRALATAITVFLSTSPRDTASSTAAAFPNALAGQADAAAHVASGTGTDAPSVRSTPQKYPRSAASCAAAPGEDREPMSPTCSSAAEAASAVTSSSQVLPSTSSSSCCCCCCWRERGDDEDEEEPSTATLLLQLLLLCTSRADSSAAGSASRASPAAVAQA